MRTQVQIVGPLSQRRTQHNFVKNRCRRVDDQVAIAGRLHDSAKVPGVNLGYGYRASLAQKTPRPLRIPVAAPHCMSLAFEELREQRTCCARPQYENIHRLASNCTTDPALP